MNVNIDYESFLKKHNMLWTTVPKSWSEGAFIGNGSIGAMMYVKEKKYFCLELGRSDVVADYKVPGIDSLCPRLEIGELSLDIDQELSTSNVHLEVDLWNAEIKGRMLTPSGGVDLRAFTHSKQDILVIELEATEGEGDIPVDFHPIHGISPRLSFYGKEGEAYELPPLPVVSTVGDIHISQQSYYKKGGYVVAWKEVYKSAKHKFIYLTIQQSLREIGETKIEAILALQQAINEDMVDYLESHRHWWHDFYRASFISIPDTKLEGFYWIQMYKIGSATRSNSHMLDLLGPWMTRTPWPGVWTNLNIQLAYSPMYISNHLDCSASLCNALDTYTHNLILNVPTAFQHDSAALGRHTSYELRDDVDIQKEYGNLTWACHNYWRYCVYKGDYARLVNKLFPLLKRAVNLYIHVMEKGEDGKWHLPQTKSPEYKHQKGEFFRDCNYDLALFRWGCQTLLRTSKQYNLNDALEGRWEDVLNNLVHDPVDENGLMIGADQPFEHGHRHYSHLLSIYPLGLRDPKVDKELILTSLKHWLSREDNMKGYTFTAASSIASLLGRGDDALRFLQVAVNHFIDPNTMYRESGPVIETPLAAAESVHDMLLHCHDGRIKIFPALPKDWKDIAIHGLRAEGGFGISCHMKESKIKFLRIEASIDGECTIEVPFNEIPETLWTSQSGKINPVNSTTYTLQLGKGEVAFIGDKYIEEYIVEAVESDEHMHNYFGGHKPWRNYQVPLKEF